MQETLRFGSHEDLPINLVQSPPHYSAELGVAYLGDSLELMKTIPSESVNLVMTSPPYALHFKKEYGNAAKSEYIAWMLPFAKEIARILKDDGSFVLNLGGSYNKGTPTRSIYHYKLLVALVEEIGFHLAQECFWYNPAKMPVPAEWVTVRRIRVRDSVEFVWWLSKTEWPKATNRNVLRPYSADMLRLKKKGLKKTTRPAGHKINAGFANTDAGGSIPPNVIDDETPTDLLKFGNNSANDPYTKRCKEAGIKIHPARFPIALPEFFIKFLTDVNDIVLDPFAGSNTTGMVSEALGRRWLAIDAVEEYLNASRFRFDEGVLSKPVGKKVNAKSPAGTATRKAVATKQDAAKKALKKKAVAKKSVKKEATPKKASRKKVAKK